MVYVADQITTLWPEHRQEALIKIFKALGYHNVETTFGVEVVNLYDFIKKQPLSDSEWISLVPYFPSEEVVDGLFMPELKDFFDRIRRKSAYGR